MGNKNSTVIEMRNRQIHTTAEAFETPHNDRTRRKIIEDMEAFNHTISHMDVK